MNLMNHSRRRLFACLLAATLLSSCGLLAPEPTPTPTPVPPTDTPVPTDTPEPTATDTPVPTATDTPEPTATPTEVPTETPNLAATAAFESTQAAEAVLETVAEDLATVNLTTGSGFLEWTNMEDVDLTIFNYNTQFWEPINDGEFYTNFVLRADITWESTSGLAICGFIIRGGDDISNDKHYKFQTIRLSGLPSWDVELWEFNSWVATTSGTIRSAPGINQENGSTNTFIIVVQDTTMHIYGNGDRLGTVVISSIAEGSLGFYAWSESGQTTCLFSNAWVWVLEE